MSEKRRDNKSRILKEPGEPTKKTEEDTYTNSNKFHFGEPQFVYFRGNFG